MPPGNLAQKAYERIQHNILCGTLRSGSVISEAALAKELGISRTPVGEAIRQLAIDGLVRQVPRYGTIVRAISPRELSEQYEMREAIESFAAGKAATRVQPEVINRLRAYCDAMEALSRRLRESGEAQLSTESLRQFLAADLAFHVLIIETAGNKRILKAVQDMRAISRIIGVSRVPHDPEVVDSTCASHRQILNALTARDPELTRRVMADHIQTGCRRAVERLKQHADAETSETDVPPELLDDLHKIEKAGRIDQFPTEPDHRERGPRG